MKIAWKILVILGALLVIVAFSMDTSVGTIGGQRVINLSLQGQQQMLLILGCVLFLAGIALFAVLKLKQTPDQEAQEVAARKASLEAAKAGLYEVGASSAERIDGALSYVAPAHDHVPGRVAAGFLIGLVWYFYTWGLSNMAGVGAAFFAFALVFALWRAPAPLVIGRLLKLNVGLIVVMSAILLSKMDRPISEVASDPRFIILVCFLIVGPIVASLVALAVIRKRTAAHK